MKLNQKVCIITGGSKGIGAAAAYKFAEEGAIVAVCDIDMDNINAVVDKINKNGGKACGFKVDVTDTEDIDKMVSSLKETYGHIDVLVNNAGIIMDAQLHKMTEAQFDTVIDVNLKGTYNCARAVIDIMREQGKGSIINTSSVAGIYGNFGQTNYAATKFGVIGFTKTWAKEQGRKGIRTNVVCPGMIATSIIDTMPEEVVRGMEASVPLKRLGKPEEIASVYAFLASDESSYMNGAVVEVSGGLVI